MSPQRANLWNELRGEVQKDLVWRKATFSAKDTFTETALGFALVKPLPYPNVRVAVFYQDDFTVGVHYQYQKTVEHKPLAWQDQIELEIDRNDQVFFQHCGEPISVKQAALLILKPLSDPNFQPPR